MNVLPPDPSHRALPPSPSPPSSPSSSPKSFVEEHFNFSSDRATQVQTAGGLLSQEPRSTGFGTLFFKWLSGFFPSRAEKEEKKSLSVDFLSKSKTANAFQNVAEKKVASFVKSLNLQQLRSLSALAKRSDISLADLCQTLVQQPKLSKSALSCQEPRDNQGIKLLIQANKDLESAKQSRNPVQMAKAKFELKQLSLVFKMTRPNTSNYDNYQTHLELRSSFKESTPSEALHTFTNHIVQDVIANPSTSAHYQAQHQKLLPPTLQPVVTHQQTLKVVEKAVQELKGPELEAYKENPDNFEMVSQALIILNELCHHRIATKVQLKLAQLFLTNPSEALKMAHDIKKCAGQIARAESHSEKESLGEFVSNLLVQSSFFKGDNHMRTIMNLTKLLIANLFTTNSQVTHNALNRFLGKQGISALSARTAPAPIYDVKEQSFHSSSLSAATAPLLPGQDKALRIDIVDHATGAFRQLILPLPKKANGQTLSTKELNQLLNFLISPSEDRKKLTLDGELKTLFAKWETEAEHLYNQARHEVWEPPLAKQITETADLYGSVDTEHVYWRHGRLALTVEVPSVHPECTVLDPSILKKCDKRLFDPKAKKLSDQPIEVELRTPKGLQKIQITPDPSHDDHGTMFYTLTSRVGDKTLTSYFNRNVKDTEIESDHSLHQRMVKEKFLERHLLRTQALCIQTEVQDTLF
ncbi:MAG: hypothetical protein JSS62_04775 [Verrucomicrobia bacterium]|nr:hypothetical protein [Verrucomicrobiota bacterium]MBS0646767.1 hypothetical protein [Verrucomicrobiota bacterium]